MRKDISFKVKGLTCHGWFFRPDNVPADKKLPVIVQCTGFGGVKEFILGPYAELHASRGFCSLAFDYRFTGASEGEPRGQVIPAFQHDDIRCAISCALEQEGVDQNKLILWGCSYGGAHAMFLGAIDHRVKAVVSIVPGVGPRELVDQGQRKMWDSFWRRITSEFLASAKSAEEPTIPIVAPKGELCLFPQDHCYDWIFTNASRAPNWRNAVTLESRLRAMEYFPAAYIDLISPRPFLMFATENDSLVQPETLKAAFARAKEPKRFELFPGTHFGLYDPGPRRDKVVEITHEWLSQHGLEP